MQPSIRIASLVAFLVLAIGAGVMWRLRHMGPREVAPLIEALAPGVSHRVERFDRRSYKDGKLVWELRAELAEYSEDSKEARVSGIHARWYPEAGRQVGISGASGTLRLSPDLRDVEQLSFQGDVLLMAGEYELRVEAAEYDRRRGQLVAPGKVVVAGPGLTVQGHGFEVDVSRRTLRIGGRVRMRFTPSQLQEGVSHVPS